MATQTYGVPGGMEAVLYEDLEATQGAANAEIALTQATRQAAEAARAAVQSGWPEEQTEAPGQTLRDGDLVSPLPVSAGQTWLWSLSPSQCNPKKIPPVGVRVSS